MKTGEKETRASISSGSQVGKKKRSRIIRTVVPLMIFGALAASHPGTGIKPDAVSGIDLTPAPIVSTGQTDGEQVKVHFIDVGQADSIYIQLPDHNDILIDAGDEDDGPAVVEYLRQQGMDDDIELLIATHPHRDHIGGVPQVMADFQVDEVLDSGLTIDSEWYQAYARSVANEGCTWEHDDHQVFNFEDVRLQILTGNESWDDVNNYSVVARLDCGEIEFLFPGDAEKEVEEMLADDISAEILKVGHHGSDSSSSPGFLSRVKPEAAVISVGADNQYGHPDAATLARLHDIGTKVLRTDRDGSTVVVTDGAGYEILDSSQVRGNQTVPK